MTSLKQTAPGSPDADATTTKHGAYTDPEAERGLAEIRRWERAARLVADDPGLTLNQKCAALLDMAFRARRTDLAGFLETAIWRACRHLFGDDSPRDTGDVIDAARRLLRRGLDRCPTCRRPLPDHDELDRWREYQHDLRRPA